jgi:hypothetical protein
MFFSAAAQRIERRCIAFELEQCKSCSWAGRVSPEYFNGRRDCACPTHRAGFDLLAAIFRAALLAV